MRTATAAAIALAAAVATAPAGQGTAWAQDVVPAVGGDGIALTVEIGRKTDRPVGNATGWFCDDPALVEAAVVTRGDVNYFVVAGVAAGTTQCRVGTDPSRSSFVFEVTVKRPGSNRRR